MSVEKNLSENVLDLTKRINDEYENKKREAEKLKKKYEADLKVAREEEKRIKKKISEAQIQVSKMED
jgi:predicted  nucleic acid-binding Zn-ribbon protein